MVESVGTAASVSSGIAASRHSFAAVAVAVAGTAAVAEIAVAAAVGIAVARISKLVSCGGVERWPHLPSSSQSRLGTS